MRLLILLLAVLPAVLALQANLAGLVDWHKPLLGQPLLEPSPPSIVETQAGRRILAITQKNVFGALDEAGEVVWRHQLDDTDPVVSYHVDGDCELFFGNTESRLWLISPQRSCFSVDHLRPMLGCYLPLLVTCSGRNDCMR